MVVRMDGSACGESEKMLAAVDDAARRNFNNYLSRSLLCCLRLLLPHMMTARTDSNVYINFRICIDSSLSANMGWVAVAYCRDYTRYGISSAVGLKVYLIGYSFVKGDCFISDGV